MQPRMATPPWPRTNPSTRTSGRQDPRSVLSGSSSSQRIPAGGVDAGRSPCRRPARWRPSQASAKACTPAVRAAVNCQVATTCPSRTRSSRPKEVRILTTSRLPSSSCQVSGGRPVEPVTGSSARSLPSVSTRRPVVNRPVASRSNRQEASTVSSGRTASPQSGGTGGSAGLAAGGPDGWGLGVPFSAMEDASRTDRRSPAAGSGETILPAACERLVSLLPFLRIDPMDRDLQALRNSWGLRGG